MQLDEKYQQQFVVPDLAEQKKQLEMKRSLMNQIVPAGGVQQLLSEHDRVYQLKKDIMLAEIERKRKQEKQRMKEHLQNLKSITDSKPKQPPRPADLEILFDDRSLSDVTSVKNARKGAEKEKEEREKYNALH
jgi:hypothetical protein